MVADACASVNRAVERRRVVKDPQEERYAVGDLRPSSEDAATLSGVRISNIVEEGQVQYVPVSAASISASGSTVCVFPQENPRRGK